MGLYSNNRTNLSDVDVPALEGYNGNVGIATAMLEAAQDDLKFFDMIIARDFQEAEMNLSGSVNESEMVSITEGALGDAWKRVVEFLKSLLAKVKAIFSAAIAKINGVVIRDNKKLVEKYRKAVLAKNLKDMKYKWAEVKNFDLDAATVRLNKAWAQDLAQVENAATVEAVSAYMDKNEDEMLDEYYGAVLNTDKVEAGEFSKEFRDKCFGETEEKDEGAESLKSEVMSTLLTCKKEVSDMEKSMKALEKEISKEITDAQKRVNEASKNVPDKQGKAEDSAKLELAKANACYRIDVKYQTVALALNREIMNFSKAVIAQNRAFFTKAAAYNPKAKNESADLFDAIDEAVEFDVETSFADYAVE